jgi:hypothetical protein
MHPTPAPQELTMRDVIVVGKTKRDAHDFAPRLEDGIRARVIAARRDSIIGAQADHWIVLAGVPGDVADIIERNAAKNGAPVTYR